MINPWNPGQYVFGFAGVTSLNGVRIDPPPGGLAVSAATWYDSRRVLAKHHKEGDPAVNLSLLDVEASQLEQPLLTLLHPSGGINEWVAGGLRWSAFGFRDGSALSVVDGQPTPGVIVRAIGPDGTLAYVDHPSNQGLWLCPPNRLPDRSQDLRLETQPAVTHDVRVYGWGQASYMVNGAARVVGLPNFPSQIRTTVKAFGWFSAVRIQPGGQWGVLYQEFEHPGRCVLHPADNATMGWVVAANSNAFRLEGALQSNGDILVVYSVGQGDHPSEIRNRLVRADEPMGAITFVPPPPPPPPPPPFEPRPISAPRAADERRYDLLRFILGDASTWPRRGPTHPMHQISRGRIFHFAKFADPNAYETWAYDDNWIYHLEDASNLETYAFGDPRWFPRYMQIGEHRAFDSGPHETIFRRRGTCAAIRREPFRRRMWLQAIYDSFDWGPDLGVRETAVVAYDPTGGAYAHDRGIELGYYAAGAGSVRWEWYRSDMVYPSRGASAQFPALARGARSDFYLVGGPETTPSLTGCFSLTIPQAPPWEQKKEEIMQTEIVGLLGPGGKFARVDPGDPRRVFFDRDSIGAHEEFEVSKPDDFFTLRAVAADVILNGAPGGDNIPREYETRPVDARGPHEKWTLAVQPDGRITAYVAHDFDGRRFTSAVLTVVRR